MKKWIIVLIAFWGSWLGAQSPAALFEKGNRLYQKEKYSEAADAYREVVDGGHESAALYFNLGNACYRNNQLAKAILYYEKAARLSPYDDDIQQNLKIARQGTIDRFEKMPEPIVRATYLAILKALPPDGWAMVGLAGFLVLLTGVALYLYSRWRRPGFALAISGLLLGILGLVLAYTHQNFRQHNLPAIVTATSSYIKSGPGEKAEDVFILHEGTKVVVTERYREWRKIRLPDGKVGWIDLSDIAII